jgi:hypothetical protein
MSSATSHDVTLLMNRWFPMRVHHVAGKCLADIARHVIGYHMNQETKVKMCVDDVAVNICVVPRARKRGWTTRDRGRRPGSPSSSRATVLRWMTWRAMSGRPCQEQVVRGVHLQHVAAHDPLHEEARGAPHAAVPPRRAKQILLATFNDAISLKKLRSESSSCA